MHTRRPLKRTLRIGGYMWRMIILVMVVMSAAARADENAPVKDARLSTFRTLYQGSGFTPPTNKEDWQKRAEYLRQQVLIAAGLWPMPPKPELKAVIHGKVERDDYTVEKVFFQSHPG